MAEKTPIQRARAKYAKKCTNKTVFFKNEEDKDILEFAESLPNFSAWVKEQLKLHLNQGIKL